MNQLTTIDAKETKEITSRSSLIRAFYEPKNAKEAKELYIKAPSIAESAKIGLLDGLQGKALLVAKKDICGDEWNAAKITNIAAKNKWFAFLLSLGLSDPRREYSEGRTARRLLEFAGYKEAGGTIETASHFREVKKIVESSKPEMIDPIYKEAGGPSIVTAKEVKEKIISTISQPLSKEEIIAKPEPVIDIKSVELFLETYPEYENIDQPLMNKELENQIFQALPDIDKESWKIFYKKLSKIIHTDLGGQDNDMQILSSFNNIMNKKYINLKLEEKVSERDSKYEKFCKEHNYRNLGL